jgi:hypothetical protein
MGEEDRELCVLILICQNQLQRIETVVLKWVITKAENPKLQDSDVVFNVCT